MLHSVSRAEGPLAKPLFLLIPPEAGGLPISMGGLDMERVRAGVRHWSMFIQMMSSRFRLADRPPYERERCWWSPVVRREPFYTASRRQQSVQERASTLTTLDFRQAAVLNALTLSRSHPVSSSLCSGDIRPCGAVRLKVSWGVGYGSELARNEQRTFAVFATWSGLCLKADRNCWCRYVLRLLGNPSAARCGSRQASCTSIGHLSEWLCRALAV